MVVTGPDEEITTYVEGYLCFYTYQFTLAPVDPIVLDFCKRYEVCLEPIDQSFWRVVILLRHFVNNTEAPRFTIGHLLRLYSRRSFEGINQARSSGK